MIGFLLFLGIPLLELALFYKIGSQIGLIQTLVLCFLTAALGMFFFKKQGMAVLWDIQKISEQGQAPLREMFNGICILLAGALLITPGFATDILGFSLFIPFVRTYIGEVIVTSLLNNNHVFMGAPFKASHQTSAGFRAKYDISDDEVIDVEVEHIDDKNNNQIT